MWTLLSLLEKKIIKKNTKILKNPYISYTAMYKDHLHLAPLKLH